MKIYRIKSGILIESEGEYFFENSDWDEFVNDDHLFSKTQNLIASKTALKAENDLIDSRSLLAPIGSQEIWASGVTYFNSKLARQEESRDAGGGDFYAKVYSADRPELFFKATANRTVGSGANVRIRRDS